MTRKEKAKLISRMLNDFFPNPSIPLEHQDPYTLLIAVLLSAQCTDRMVNKVTRPLFEKARTPEEMIQLTQEEIQKIIMPCGLSSFKSKAILALSHILLDKHQGQVPQNFKDLEALPGVGHKTASVVMIQAFGLPAFPVDTHIHRLAKRWGLSSGKSVGQTEKDLKKIFPKKEWGRLHLQIIYYARSYCPALRHHIEKCPICFALENK